MKTLPDGTNEFRRLPERINVTGEGRFLRGFTGAKYLLRAVLFCAAVIFCMFLCVFRNTDAEAVQGTFEHSEELAENGDYRIDFKGRRWRVLPDGSVTDEFWFDEKKWFAFGEITEPSAEIGPDGNFIMFSRVKNEAGFAPRAKFGDFIARFDFQTLPEGDGAVKLSPFGLSFGRESLASAASAAPGIYFEPIYEETVGDNGGYSYKIKGTRITAVNMAEDGASGIELGGGYNVYADSNTWWTCMVIASNRTAKVYLKKTDEGGVDFTAPIAVFTYEDARGCVAVTHNPAENSCADYKVTNISVIGTDLFSADSGSNVTADSVTGDFRGGGDCGWMLNESAAVSPDGIRTGAHGKITSPVELRNFMIRLSFGSLQRGFELSFGACSIRFDGARISVTKMEEVGTGESSFLMDDSVSEGCIVQIEVVGRYMYVSLKRKDETQSALLLAEAVFRYKDGVPITSGEISVSAYSGASFCLEKVSAYSLNAAVEIETEHCNESGQSENGVKKGCGSAAYSAGAASVGGTLASAAAILLAAWRKKKKKNG